MRKLAGILAFCLAFGTLAASSANAVYTDKGNLPSRKLYEMEYRKLTAQASSAKTSEAKKASESSEKPSVLAGRNSAAAKEEPRKVSAHSLSDTKRYSFNAFGGPYYKSEITPAYAEVFTEKEQSSNWGSFLIIPIPDSQAYQRYRISVAVHSDNLRPIFGFELTRARLAPAFSIFGSSQHRSGALITLVDADFAPREGKPVIAVCEAGNASKTVVLQAKSVSVKMNDFREETLEKHVIGAGHIVKSSYSSGLTKEEFEALTTADRITIRIYSIEAGYVDYPLPSDTVKALRDFGSQDLKEMKFDMIEGKY